MAGQLDIPEEYQGYDGEVDIKWKTTHVEARMRKLGFLDTFTRRYLSFLPGNLYVKTIRLERIFRWKFKRFLRKYFDIKVIKFVPIKWTLEPPEEMVCCHNESVEEEITDILTEEIKNDKRAEEEGKGYWAEKVLSSQEEFNKYIEESQKEFDQIMEKSIDEFNEMLKKVNGTEM